MSAGDTVEIEYRGRTYAGRYSIKARMITVDSEYGSKTTQVGNTPVEAIAKQLLREIIREAV